MYIKWHVLNAVIKCRPEMEPVQTNWPVTRPDPVALDQATRMKIYTMKQQGKMQQKKQSLKVS